MPSPDPGAETRREIQQIQKRMTEINAEYAYLMAKKISDGKTVRKIHWLRLERSALNLWNRGS
jgi:predicted thioredoxin/glutaredoxin